MLNQQEQYEKYTTEKSIRSANFIIPDTSFWMELSSEGSNRFVDRLDAYLLKYGKQVLVPDSCRLELEKHIHGDDPAKAILAKNAMNFIIRLYGKGLLSFHADSSGILSLLKDDFADPFLDRVAATLWSKGNVLVLTQDKNLCWDLLNHRSIKSPYHLIVKSVSPYGWLKNPDAFYEWRKLNEGDHNGGNHHEN